MKALLVCATAASLLAVAAAGAATPLAVDTVLATRQPGVITVRAGLSKNWTNAALAPSTTNRLYVFYDSNADGKADYTGRIVYRGKSLVEEITGHGNTYEPIPVARPSGKALRFTHPVDVLYTGVARRKTLRIALRMKSGTLVTRVPKTWLIVPDPR